MNPKYLHNYEKFVPGKDTVLYSGPYWNNDEIDAAIEALCNGRWITSGEYVAKFERFFGRYFGVKHCLMVNSGSSANLTMIAALKKRFGWKDGAGVIVSPVGFPTTVAPLVQNGLRPIFVDIEWDTLNFDLEQVEKECNNLDVVAIFVSPVLGNPPDMDILISFAKRFGLKLIGDSCDSIGTKWSGRHLSDCYTAWSTSFYPAHHITCGEGGMVCSDDEELIDLARSFAWWGRGCYCVGSANLLPCGTCGDRFSCHLKELPEYEHAIIDHKYLFENMGYNLKPLDLQGAIGLVQLQKLPEIEVKRREAFGNIKQMLYLGPEQLSLFRVANQHMLADPCWFGVPIIAMSRDAKESLVAHLESNKIQTRHYFAGNILAHPGYRHLDDYKKYPNANKVLKSVFFVGCNPGWTRPVFDYIKQVLEKWEGAEES